MEQNREIYRFRKNSREEIVISIFTVGNENYLCISRCYYDRNGEEQFRRNSICMHHLLVYDLITGIQKALQTLGGGTRLFLSKQNLDKTH